MLEKALWIGKAAGEYGPWKTEKKTKEKITALAEHDPSDTASALYRKSFVLRDGIVSATLSICGLGFYDVFVNGAMPDPDRVLTPIPSDYYKKARCDVYDALSLVKPGENVLGVHLCGGWFSPPVKWWTSWQMTWYGNPRLIAQLEVMYADGSTDTVLSDETWKYTDGPVLKSCIYDGEIYDHRRRPNGWNTVGFDCTAWKTAAAVEALPDRLEASYAPPVRIIRKLDPIAVTQNSDTLYTYDFGENNAIIPEVTVRGASGDTVTLRFSEFIYPDGTLDRRSENRAECTDIYTLAGGTDVCTPRFTWHGGRYMTVSLSSPGIEIVSAKLCVIHSDVEKTGHFECSRPELNRLHEMYIRTQLACLQGFPIDCPQRHERKGWLGDAHAAAEMCLYNFDMNTLYASFLADMELGRTPVNGHGRVQIISPENMSGETSIDWNLAYPFILQAHYERYRDPTLLQKHYPSLKDHVQSYIDELQDGFIQPCWFGDWFSVDREEDTNKVSHKSGHERHRQNPPFLGTMFFCQTLRIIANIAEILGLDADAAFYRKLREASREALIRRCYDSEKHLFGSGGQFLLTFALDEGLVPEADRPQVFENLVRTFEDADWHTLFGVIGYRKIFDVFDSFDRPDLAYRLFSVSDYPSPLNMLSDGRTTLTEGLDGSGSGCHCMFGSPDSFFYKTLCGVRIDRTHEIPIEIKPFCPDDMDFARCTQKLPEGILSCEWRRADGKLLFDIEIPETMQAKVKLKSADRVYETTAGGKLHIEL